MLASRLDPAADLAFAANLSGGSMVRVVLMAESTWC
jgi:hypothetical protein